jgi:hypothetical protein
MSEHRLNEIVIERPRHGMRCPYRKLKGVKKELERLTREASEDGFLSPYLIKVRHRTKSLADHLGPLRRYLRSRVGEPWNDIYSDLSQRLDANSLTGQHVRDHLWDYVERHVELIDGVPHRKPYAGRLFRQLGDRYYDEFYVHPETGLLCLAERRSQRELKKRQGRWSATVGRSSEDCVVIDDTRQYRKINEIWYCITLKTLPLYLTVWDVLLKDWISPEIAQKHYGKMIYASRKQQCNKREIAWIQSKI